MDIAEYLNQTVWARLAPSKIHGVGVFAIRDIPIQTCITDYTDANVKGHWNYTGNGHMRFVELDTKDFPRILPEIRELILDRYLLDATAETFGFVSPNHSQLLQSFMNHSEQPNTENCITTRAVRKGEELTEDFRQLYRLPHRFTRRHHPYLYADS